ncbi:MAG: hypothetical protein IKR47_08140 [Lachnospiraceae bacterium]|nr:hypothetical protein [Lachnospiraceae bacterium]
MDSIRDRFGGRDRMGSDRGGRDRYDRPERDDMGERMSRRNTPSYGNDGVGIDDIANVIEQSNSKQLEVFADCIDDVKDEVYASEKEIMKALDQIASSSSSSRSLRQQEAGVARMDPAAKEEILRAVSNNTELLYALQETLKKAEEKEAEKEKAPEEAVAEENAAAEEQPKQEDPLITALTQYYNNMEEHVHKENVKCYRNVQAALSEQATQIVEQNKKALGFLKVFAIVSVVLSFINIALFVCFILGII